MEVLEFIREMIPDVLDFERRLRIEEPSYCGDIDEAVRFAQLGKETFSVTVFIKKSITDT